MNERLDAERKPKSRLANTRTGEAARSDSNYCDALAIEIERFAEHCRVPGKPPLPVAFANKNRGGGHELRNTHRFEGAAVKSCDPKNLKIVFGDNEDIGELCIARLGTEQSHSSNPRSSGRRALAKHAPGVRERDACRPKGDKPAEGMD